MKLLLSGYPGSKKILRASSYLVRKYLGEQFDVYWLNYGVPVGDLLIGQYVSLAPYQASVKLWATDIRRYLLSLEDEFIIFALDDYLLTHPLDGYRYAMLYLKARDPNIVCARLCTSDFYQRKELELQIGEIIQLSSGAQYSATTQYCIWRREFLYELLGQVSTPWEFEIYGSQCLNTSGRAVIGSRPPALEYPHASSLSSKWRGISVRGVSQQDINSLIEFGFVDRNELIDIGKPVL